MSRRTRVLVCSRRKEGALVPADQPALKTIICFCFLGMDRWLSPWWWGVEEYIYRCVVGEVLLGRG